MQIERIFTGCMAVICFALVFVAWGFVAPIAYDPLGPRPYPLLILSLLIISFVYLTFRPKKFAEVLDLQFLQPQVLKKIALTLLFFFIYAFTFELLGFPLATAIMCFALGKLFNGTTKASLISAIILSAFCYIIFDYCLDVPLPLGMFG